MPEYEIHIFKQPILDFSKEHINDELEFKTECKTKFETVFETVFEDCI